MVDYGLIHRIGGYALATSLVTGISFVSSFSITNEDEELLAKAELAKAQAVCVRSFEELLGSEDYEKLLTDRRDFALKYGEQNPGAQTSTVMFAVNRTYGDLPNFGCLE